MTRLVLKFVGGVLSFFLIWFLLSQIDWVTLFHVKKNTNKMEEKIGELYVEMIQQNETMIEADSLVQPIVDIIDQIKEANHIDTDIQLHVIDKDEVNAFAMPDDNLVVFSGLIEECQSPEELAGVLGHEIAHIEEKHVMKKLIKEVGLSVLLSMTGGNGTVIQESFKTLTSSAYDRTLESEADLTSIEYLKNADIDYRPFAEFLFRLSLEESDFQQGMQLLSSHPASEERATAILEKNEYDENSSRPLMTEEKWILFRDYFKSVE